jgi:hypothetical protein
MDYSLGLMVRKARWPHQKGKAGLANARPGKIGET